VGIARPMDFAKILLAPGRTTLEQAVARGSLVVFSVLIVLSSGFPLPRNVRACTPVIEMTDVRTEP
jgi:hypothetical protein